MGRTRAGRPPARPLRRRAAVWSSLIGIAALILPSRVGRPGSLRRQQALVGRGHALWPGSRATRSDPVHDHPVEHSFERDRVMTLTLAGHHRQQRAPLVRGQVDLGRSAHLEIDPTPPGGGRRPGQAADPCNSLVPPRPFTARRGPPTVGHHLVRRARGPRVRRSHQTPDSPDPGPSAPPGLSRVRSGDGAGERADQRARSHTTCLDSSQISSSAGSRPLFDYEGVDHLSPDRRLGSALARCPCRPFGPAMACVHSVEPHLWLAAQYARGTWPADQALAIAGCA